MIPESRRDPFIQLEMQKEIACSSHVFVPMDTEQYGDTTSTRIPIWSSSRLTEVTDANFAKEQQNISKRSEEKSALNIHSEAFYVIPDYCSNEHLSSSCPAADSVTRLNTRLLDAIEGNYTLEVERLLQNGVNPNATCHAKHISACHAAAYDNIDALNLLLKYKADKNRRDRLGRTPLHLAAWAGNIRAMAMLLDFPADLQNKMNSIIPQEIEHVVKALRPRIRSMVDIASKFEMSNFPSAWEDSTEHKCERYLSLIPNFSAGWTALHITSYAGHHSATRLLLAAGADPNSKDAIGHTPLDVAGGAYYLKTYDVNVGSYVDTIKALVAYGGELTTAEGLSNSNLHTAVDLRSVEAIKILLAKGASITHRNTCGNTPLHKCVSKHYKEPLQILANHRRPGQTFPSVDVTDSSGYTVLQRAVLISWLPGVTIALDAGADVTFEDKKGYTSVHFAARIGNYNILNEIIKVAKLKNAVDIENGRVESPLFCAIRSRNLGCVRIIVDAGASIKLNINASKSGNVTGNNQHSALSTAKLKPSELNNNVLLHFTAEFGCVEMLEFFLYQDKNLELLLSYTYLNRTPVESAALYNKFESFKFLLNKTVERAQATQQQFDPSNLWKIAFGQNQGNMFNEIIRAIPNVVHILNEKGQQPLHDAIWFGTKSLIKLLIQNGGDLSQCDERGNTAISLLFKYRSKPKEFIESIFDSQIQTNDDSKYSAHWEVTIDYSVMVPKAEIIGEEQMKVFKALLKTGNSYGQSQLLTHPLAESFLYLKWKSFSIFFYMMIFLYGLFATSLSVFIVSVFYYKDKARLIPYFWDPDIWQYFIFSTLGIIVIQELSYFNMNWLKKEYLIESVVKFGSFLLAIATPLVITTGSPNTDWRRHLAVLTLVTAWANIMLLLSKAPVSGYYMHLFWNVSTKIIEILLTFLFLIIMFSFCFMIQFHTEEPFDGPLAAFLKTLVMMMSEFDYDQHFNKKTAETLSTSVLMLRFVFVVFLILAAIVLMNLMIGVAVHDVQYLVNKGHLRRLEKQVGFLSTLEVSRQRQSFFCNLGLHRWLNCKNVPLVVKFRSIQDSECCFNSQIKEALLKKAQQQLEKVKMKQQSVKNESKLDEILQTIAMQKQNVANHDSKLEKIIELVSKKERSMTKNETMLDDILEAVKVMERKIATNELKLDEILKNMRQSKIK